MAGFRRRASPCASGLMGVAPFRNPEFHSDPHQVLPVQSRLVNHFVIVQGRLGGWNAKGCDAPDLLLDQLGRPNLFNTQP